MKTKKALKIVQLFTNSRVGKTEAIKKYMDSLPTYTEEELSREPVKWAYNHTVGHLSSLYSKTLSSIIKNNKNEN